MLLNTYDNLVIVGTAATGPEAIAMCAALQPDVMLLDAELPIIDGFTAAQVIHQQTPRTKIIMLISAYIGQDQALSIGWVSMILKKPIVSEVIVRVIRIVHTNDIHLQSQNNLPI